jgi:hypothetical protein
MRSRYNKLAATTMFGVLLALTPAAPAAEKTLEPKKIAQLAKDAKTSAEHSEVAKQYRQHAASLEKRAVQFEQEARVQDAGPTRAMEQKWPAMIVNARERKAQMAVQARRAAQESVTLAEHHETVAQQGGERVASRD